MKWVFFALILANLALAAYGLASQRHPLNAAQLASLEVNRDKVKILP